MIALRGMTAQWRVALRAVQTAAAIFAVILQVAIIQPHVHTFVDGHLDASVANTIAGKSNASVVQDQPSKNAIGCLVCQTLASTGGMLAPAGAILKPAHGRGTTVGLVGFAQVDAAPAHPWQSRAPPVLES